MNHGSDPVWEERILRSDLDAEVRWARPDLGDYWDATGFVTALEGFFHSREDFDFVWFGHTKGGSKQFNDDQHIRSELIDTFWERRGDVARAFGDPAIGLFAPRYNLTPPYPFAGPPHGWTNQLSALQRVYRDARPPLGLCALDTFFVIRGDIVRRFCDAVGEEFFRIDPGTYGANKWFFEMAFPSIASMQGFVPWIDMDVPGVNDPRDDLMLSWDVKQTHRLAIAEVARWREDLTGFQPRIIAWDRLPWEQPRSKRDRSDPDLVIGELKSDEARLRNPPQLARSIAHRVEAEGWHVPPGESAMQPLLDAPNHSLRVVFPTPPRDAFRIRLALTLKDMEVLRLGLWSAIDDELPRERNVWLDGVRPGALHHELERVALYANPALAYFELSICG